MDTFQRLESEVRGYCRTWPTVFSQAKDHRLYAEDGREYIDFFAGAGALNYGHNNFRIKRRLIEYLSDDNIIHGLDMSTPAKRTFMERFDEVILAPRGMRYKFQFPGPTGTNAVEAALKLARKVTGREKIVGFTHAFHGMTLGSLAVTGNGFKRAGAGVSLGLGVSMPYDGYLGDDVDTLDYFEAALKDSGSGLDEPAAVIVETIQAEGGINVASAAWLSRLAEICQRRGIVFIVDDIQVGCGRTGPFFSFDGMGFQPDIICLSKSLSGSGLPMALTLIKPEMDVWEPGEHNGTFRGNNPAFVTATEALTYWENSDLTYEIAQKAALISSTLHRIADRFSGAELEVRGRGMIQGLKSGVGGFAKSVVHDAFQHGLVIETSGAESEVVKLLPPLTIEVDGLRQGLAILERSVATVAYERRLATEPALA